MRPTLLIVLEGESGRALAVAKVESHFLLTTAARVAIREKQQQAEKLSSHDMALAVVAREEAHRLERTLGALIPELDTEPASAVVM
jgi:hypothetical protein